MLRNRARFVLSAVITATLIAPAVLAQQADGGIARVEALLTRAFPADGPGAAVIALKKGKVAFRKAYGLANLETRTPMRPEMVFEIGSVTKQFTSTAILMLVEQGKLALTDDVRRYIPDFPDKGVTITIEHLLTHTSGIKSYTEDPKWPPMWRQDLTPAQVIAITRDAPLDFPPGTKWNYNNTAYTMLGVIIEKVTGVAYADVIRQHVLEPIGMSHTLYGSLSAIVPNRASGYTRGEKGWENAPYLSMTQPYSAGALMSTVDDLARWDSAVSAGRLLSAASWTRAFTGFKLVSGEDTGYGYGWQIGEFEGRRLIHHGGGIPGYTSVALRMPADDIYVAVLTNSDAPPVDLDYVAVTIGSELIGTSNTKPGSLQLSPAVLDAYVGVYRINETDTRTFTREGTRLFMQRSGRPKVELFPSADAEFAPRESVQRLSFKKDAAGRVVEVVSDNLGSRERARKIE